MLSGGGGRTRTGVMTICLRFFWDFLLFFLDFLLGRGCAGGAQRGMTKGFNVNDSGPPSLAHRNERVREIPG